MARGVNKVILIGNLGADPETRHTASGNAITRISLATAESWKDRNTGERQERTEWHRVVFFNRLAEIAGEYLRKGSRCYIEGRIQTQKWQKDGQDRYTTEIIAADMQMLGGRDEMNRGGGGGGASRNAPASNSRSSGAGGDSSADWPGNEGDGGGSGYSGGDAGDDFDDDIPF